VLRTRRNASRMRVSNEIHKCNGLVMSISQVMTKAIGVFTFISHQITSTVVLPALVADLTFAGVFVLRSMHVPLSNKSATWILTETPYFPFQIVGAWLFGFICGTYWKHRSMLWVWVLPAFALILAGLFASSLTRLGGPSSNPSHFANFFGWSCLPQNHCLFQVAFTMPLYSAAAYSLGALLSRKRHSLSWGRNW
jgi:hypothetical protein